jgi:hypothetical protein
MKYIISAILLIVLGMLTYGFYIKSSGDSNGEIIIGISVLVVAFVLMPLFIYHRYKGKDLSNFKFDNFRKDLEEHNKKKSPNN